MKKTGTLWVLPGGRLFDFKDEETGEYIKGDGIIKAPHLSYDDLCQLAGKRCEVTLSRRGSLLDAEVLP